MSSLQEYVWTEKYRPDSLSEVKGNEVIVDRMKKWVDDPAMPNLLFAGPQGVGKTAMAVAFAKEKYGDDWKQHFKQLNASDDRGIDVVRNEIQGFAEISTVSDYEFKIIFLDEADALCLPPGTEVVTGYPSSPEVKPIEEVEENGESIPSINFDTNELQSDSGKVLQTGEAEFYDITFSDGRETTASARHPFFVVRDNEELQEIQVQELESGDKVADFKDKIEVTRCEVCENWTGNSRFCCKECKNKAHSERMSDPSFNNTKGEDRPDPTPTTDGGRQEVDTVEVESVEFSHEGKAYNITMEGTPNFMLANGILTHNTKDAQPALRRIMEDYSDRTRFVLSCNYPRQIIDPIQSRCTTFRVQPLADDVMFGLLTDIAKREGVEYAADQIETIVQMVDGDARNGIHTLQSVSVDGSISDDTLDRLAVFPDREDVEEAFSLAIAGQLEPAMEKIEQSLEEGVDPVGLCDDFVYCIEESDLPSDAKVKMLDKVAETEWRILNGSKAHIQFHSLLANLRVARHLSLAPYKNGE